MSVCVSFKTTERERERQRPKAMEVQNVCGDLGSGNAQVYHILNTFITLESDFFLLESGHLCLLVAFGLVMAKQCKVKFIMCYQRRV